MRLIRRNPFVVEIAGRASSLAVPDAWLAGGCLFQTVWNALAGECPSRGIEDYDLFYFDRSNLTEEAEGSINRRAAELFSDLDCEIDVRNQARVHLWYPMEFGVERYPELNKSTDGVDRFLAICCMVAVRATSSGGVDLYSPLGVDDVFERVMRPNPWFPNAPRDCYDRKARRWQALWPELRVEPMPESAR